MRTAGTVRTTTWRRLAVAGAVTAVFLAGPARMAEGQPVEPKDGPTTAPSTPEGGSAAPSSPTCVAASRDLTTEPVPALVVRAGEDGSDSALTRDGRLRAVSIVAPEDDDDLFDLAEDELAELLGVDEGEVERTPALVLVTGPDAIERTDDLFGHFARQRHPQVIDVSIGANPTPDLLQGALDRYVANAAPDVEGLELQATGATPTLIEVELEGRPARVGVAVSDPKLVRDGVAVDCQAEGALQIPFTVRLGAERDRTAPAAALVAGDAVEVLIDGEPQQAQVVVAPQDDPTKTDDRPDASEDDDDEEAGSANRAAAAGGGGGGLPMVPIVLVVLGALAAAAFVVLRRNEVGPSPDAYLGGVPAGGPPGGMPVGGWPAGAPAAAVAAVPPVAPRRAVAPAAGARRAAGGPVAAPVPARAAAPGWTGAVPFDTTVRIQDLGLMRLLPRDTEGGRSWASEQGDLTGAGWLEKKDDLGEDAEPTLRSHESGRGLIGVYDGTGGAGSATARRLRGGQELSGAYVASRLVRDLTENWFANVVEGGLDSAEVGLLRSFVASSLDDEAEFLADTSTLRGKLSRVLPTTLAAVAYAPLPDDGTLADVIWAGDSRAYVLTPDDGLQALSLDDTRESDALALIRNDQPMDNLISADRPFRLNHRRLEVAGPAVLLVATDGCFGYLRTPAHFEYLLLEVLQGAADLASWTSGVIDALGAFTADDASFALVARGFGSFASLQAAFGARHGYLATEHWDPFRAAGDDRDAVELLREESWAVYRDLYEARMPRPS